MFVDFTNVLVTGSFDGEIKVNAFATGSGFETKLGIPIANYASSAKGTFAAISSVKSMHAAGTIIDTIMIQEHARTQLQTARKLSSNSRQDSHGTPLQQSKRSMGVPRLDLHTGKDDSRTLLLPHRKPVWGALDNRDVYSSEWIKIYVDDENVAKKGDVTVDISGSNVTNQSIIVAKYTDYEVTVEEKTSKEVVSGKWDTELGSFLISEQIQGSLIPGRPSS